MSAVPTFGPLIADDGVTFRLWAPAAQSVDLVLGKAQPMQRGDGGWFKLHVPGAKAGTRYSFRIDGDVSIADPASHFQPDDVGGASEVIDHDYNWRDASWKGRPWEQAVFLETHVGTFTPEGTYRAMIDKLDHLVETGITALELMPLADFPGRWNWGYDGVLLYAPDSSYGRPEDLKALIDAAHQRGLMVFLDVVYNHFGPEGNYLHRIAPPFFTDAHTPWGSAIDYRVPEVRAFAVENAVHWLRHYRFDGLRLDAVHAIVAPGEPNVLEDISKAVGVLARETGRHIHLVLENDDNTARRLAPLEDPPSGHYKAQWNDDYHHAWHVLLTAETQGYYRDYDDAARHVARTLAEGFAYQGEGSPHRDDAPRGEPSAALPRLAFVNFIQNHDQIGNRPLGERLTVLVDENAVAAALSVLLLQPGPPLLFMGDEWGAREAFPFFCDFKGDLADAVRNGRKREFAEAYARHGDEIPDPLAERTRDLAVLDWAARDEPAHTRRLELTRSLLAARHRHIVPLLQSMTGAGTAAMTNGLLTARWPANGKALCLLANLSGASQPRPQDLAWGSEPVWGPNPPDSLPPWSVYAAIGG
ncbi:MAG TPA: malto-oligosyltrehalose trehalohydrolase [Pseudolabrys sp.]|nr:malto-oligosyltrehalose trehalohydrolase [Pseudolabrys sp.]